MKFRLNRKKRTKSSLFDEEDHALKETYSADPYCMTDLTELDASTAFGNSTMHEVLSQDSDEVALERLTRRLREDPAAHREAQKILNVLSILEKSQLSEPEPSGEPEERDEVMRTESWKKTFSTKARDKAKKAFWAFRKNKNERKSKSAANVTEPEDTLPVRATTVINTRPKRTDPVEDSRSSIRDDEVELVESHETSVSSYSDLATSSSQESGVIEFSFRINKTAVCHPGEDWNPSMWLSSFFCQADDEAILETMSSEDK